MIPVNNSGALSVKSLTTSSRLGWGLSGSDLSTNETLTYAHIGAAGFHADKSAGDPGAMPGGRSGYGEAVSRNAFQDLLNANAAALAASEGGGRGSAPAQASGRGGLVAAGASGQQAKAEPKWNVSMEGGRIHLSINPNAK